MEMKNRTNKKKQWVQGVLFVMVMSLVSACGQSGGSSGESLLVDNASSGITVVQTSEGLINKSACAGWGNTRMEVNGEQVHCIPLKGQAPYKRLVFE